MLRRMTPSSAQLTGGDLSVDILHTEDSVQIGDGTNLLGAFALVESKRVLPTQVLGVSKTKITDSTETDYAEIEDVGGEKALKVSVIASVGGGGGGTAATDSSAFTATATQGTPIMGALDDTASDALAEGEMGIVRMTSARAMHVAVQNSVAVTGTFWQATQPVSGTVTVGNASLAVTGTFWQATQPVSAASLPLPTGAATDAKLDTIIGHVDGLEGLLGTIDTDTGNMATSLAALDNALASVATDSLRATITNASLAVTGTFWQATQPVSIASMPATPVTDNGGSLTVDGTVAATQSGTWNVGTLTSITNTVTVSGTVTASSTTGAAAHDAAASGNPVLIAARANNANPTSVAAGDTTYLNADLAGRMVVTFSDRALMTHATGSQATTTEATMLAAGGAGVFHDLTNIILTNSNTTTAAQVQIRDATAGTIRFEHVIPANSGMVVHFNPPLNQATANNNWTIDLNAAVSTVYYTVQAVKRVA